jgi:hypothetical protein
MSIWPSTTSPSWDQDAMAWETVMTTTMSVIKRIR